MAYLLPAGLPHRPSAPGQSASRTAFSVDGAVVEPDGHSTKRRRVSHSSSASTPPLPRRPLSCTPCKQRKTRCSSSVIPCEACLKRGKPDECVWETRVGELLRPENTFALASDLEVLRTQIRQLAQEVRALSSTGALAPPPPTLTSSSEITTTGTSSVPLPNNDEKYHKIEAAVTSLETLPTAQGESSTPSMGTLPSVAPYRGRALSRLLDRNTRPVELLDVVFDLVPPRETSDKLVRAYLEGPHHRGWHVLHGSLFLSEVEAFYSDPSPIAQKTSTDPTWLSIFFMVLALGLQVVAVDDALALFPKYDTTAVARLPSALYQASLLALEVGKCDVRPQIRHIQVILLYLPFLYHFGFGPEESNVALSHLAAAISTAEWLELDRLPPTAGSLPFSDPAFPPSLPPHVPLEITKRLYGMLNFCDGTAARRPRFTLSESSTTLPLNLNDEDLIPGAGREGEGLGVPRERRREELTDATLARVGSLFAQTVRKFKDFTRGKMEEDKGSAERDEMDYLTIPRYDGALRAVLAQLPSPLLEVSPDPNWMQCALFASIQNRLVRLHRPFMVRGYTEARYRWSTDTSIESARSLVQSQRLLMACPHLRPGFIKKWILSASMVLTVDYVVSIDLHEPAAVLAPKRRALHEALEIFQQSNPLDRTPRVTVQCVRTVEALLRATEERERRQSVESASTTGDGVGGLHEFFQKVAMKLSSALPLSEDLSASTTLMQLSAEPVASPLQLLPLSVPAGHFSSFPQFLDDMTLPGLRDADGDVPASSFDFGLFGGWEGVVDDGANGWSMKL